MEVGSILKIIPSIWVSYAQIFRHSLISRFKSIDKYDWAFVAVLIAAALTRSYEISLPYLKFHETAFQEIIAKNHYYYGFAQTHFLSVFSVVDGENIYHLSHPPLLQILIALSYTLFGVHEWSARLVPILFSLGSIVLLYIIVQILFNKETAVLTSIFASFMPMSAYFGRIVNFEAVVLFFVLLVVLGYMQWVETSKKKYYYLAMGGTVLGGLVDWPFFLILPFLLGSSLLTGKKIRSTICLFMVGCSVAGGYLLLKGYILGYDQGFTGWFSHLLARSDISSYIDKEWYTRLGTRLWENFTVVLLLLSGFGFLRTFKGLHFLEKFRAKTMDIGTLIPLCLLFFGSSYVVLFPQSTFVHEWELYYLIPGISIYAGIGLYTIIHEVKGHQCVIAGTRILAVSLLILFLIISVNTLSDYHHGRIYHASAYNIGLFIDNNCAPDDYICNLLYVNPIMYYANRSNCQYITSPNITMIQLYGPQFVIYPSGGSGWTNPESDFVKFLHEQQYIPISLASGAEMWAKDVNSLPLLCKEMHSIEMYDFSSHERIEQISDYQGIHTRFGAGGNIVLYEHPSPQGIVVVNYAVTVPSNASLTFSAGLDEQTWAPEKGDGVTFEIYLNASGTRSLVFSKYIDPKANASDRKWHEFTVPLHEYAGEDVILGFATSPGPNRNNAYDWAYWINPRFTVSE